MQERPCVAVHQAYLQIKEGNGETGKRRNELKKILTPEE
jgi:hypothetical protein